MKRFFTIVLLFSLGCKAQTTYSLLDDGIGITAGDYYKDTYEDFDKFVGTWRYQSGSTIFEITLQKKVMFYNPDFSNYSDMLIGEYKYVNDIITVVNTLPNLQINLHPYQNNIAGEYIMDKSLPVSQRRVKLNFTDPARDYLNYYIVVKHLAAQGGNPERIEIEFRGETSVVPDENSPTELRVPEQNYTLVKVP